MPTLYDADGNEVEIPDNVGDLRNIAEQAQKEKREAEARANAAEQELAPILKERREATALSVAEEAKLPKAAALTWLRLNPEGTATPEAIATLAAELGLSTVQEEPPAEPPPATPAPTPYQPVAEAPAQPANTEQDWPSFIQRLNDPSTHAQAMRDFDEGRVARTSTKR